MLLSPGRVGWCCPVESDGPTHMVCAAGGVSLSPAATLRRPLKLVRAAREGRAALAPLGARARAARPMPSGTQPLATAVALR